MTSFWEKLIETVLVATPDESPAVQRAIRKVSDATKGVAAAVAPGKWVALTPAAGWTVSAPLACRVDASVLYLRGRASGQTATTLFVLSKGKRPSQAMTLATVSVALDGTVRSSSNEVNLDGVVIPL